ncbi:hypothetical protein R3P38DRAFT_3467670 [Favolaschia claudopus]|uniref:Uncharacterized protein n=1 Tax=Favolaschia claudopus TaxID=2862362 RepID=A0AAW0CNC7_9AGAR
MDGCRSTLGTPEIKETGEVRDRDKGRAAEMNTEAIHLEGSGAEMRKGGGETVLGTEKHRKYTGNKDHGSKTSLAASTDPNANNSAPAKASMGREASATAYDGAANITLRHVRLPNQRAHMQTQAQTQTRARMNSKKGSTCAREPGTRKQPNKEQVRGSPFVKGLVGRIGQQDSSGKGWNEVVFMSSMERKIRKRGWAGASPSASNSVSEGRAGPEETQSLSQGLAGKQ